MRAQAPRAPRHSTGFSLDRVATAADLCGSFGPAGSIARHPENSSRLKSLLGIRRRGDEGLRSESVGTNAGPKMVVGRRRRRTRPASLIWAIRAFHGGAGHLYPFPVELAPHLAGAVAAVVVLEDPGDVLSQHFLFSSTSWTRLRSPQRAEGAVALNKVSQNLRAESRTGVAQIAAGLRRLS
jgi:hypothetical protein